MLTADASLSGLQRSTSLSAHVPAKVPALPHLHHCPVLTAPRSMEGSPEPAVITTSGTNECSSVRLPTVATPTRRLSNSGLSPVAQPDTPAPQPSVSHCSEADACAASVDGGGEGLFPFTEDEPLPLQGRRASCSHVVLPSNREGQRRIPKCGWQGTFQGMAAKQQTLSLPSKEQQITAISRLQQPLSVVTQKKSLIRCVPHLLGTRCFTCRAQRPQLYSEVALKCDGK
jgi:hypothetical protein